jgi:polyisoprenoid-binding protein YceI
MSAVAIPEVKKTMSTWNIDPVHSAAQFKVKHMMISNVKGEFTSLKGGLQLDEQNLEESRIEAEIDAATINTRDLSIRGVTRPVTFAVEGPSAPAKDPWGNTRIGLSATTKINRKDFGLTWNAALETGGILVGDEVTITLDVQFVKAN